MDKDRTIRISNEDHLVIKTLSIHTDISMKELLHQALGVLAGKYTELRDYLPEDYEIIGSNNGTAEENTNN